MESNWAAEHLQVIRTLMERSALYRRALAPIMLYNGIVGSVAAVLAWRLRICPPKAFIVYWALVAVGALAGSLLLVRRQALKDKEPFWSPPTRRVTQALLPPLVAGGICTVGAFLRPPMIRGLGPPVTELWLPLSWVVLYGCAIHAAGFFMPRGMRLFGWGFIVAGCALLAADLARDELPHYGTAHIIMGTFFGGFHLAYGLYLYFTERRRAAA
ncbi:MAG TPA: hypothetical protein VMU04_12050 [Candidatus Acidoferrum sp.]|nr:hypothetical protein [Candidatus Acidoferrum sp.]